MNKVTNYSNFKLLHKQTQKFLAELPPGTYSLKDLKGNNKLTRSTLYRALKKLGVAIKYDTLVAKGNCKQASIIWQGIGHYLPN